MAGPALRSRYRDPAVAPFPANHPRPTGTFALGLTATTNPVLHSPTAVCSATTLYARPLDRHNQEDGS